MASLPHVILLEMHFQQQAWNTQEWLIMLKTSLECLSWNMLHISKYWASIQKKPYHIIRKCLKLNIALRRESTISAIPQFSWKEETFTVCKYLLRPMTTFHEAKNLNTKLQVLKVWYISWSIPVKVFLQGFGASTYFFWALYKCFMKTRDFLQKHTHTLEEWKLVKISSKPPHLTDFTNNIIIWRLLSSCYHV